jgi:hypothetical protein
MKSFLFITTLTPKQFLTPLRTELFSVYLNALKAQKYKNWNALLIGDEDKLEENIIYLKSDAISKTEKLEAAYKYLLELNIKPDYIIRIDDDDLISPYILESVSKIEFDCYSDLYHSFYDLTTGKTSQLKRDWLPNTVIHKYEHAMVLYGDNNLPLFMHDHSKSWHVFYKGKKLLFAPKKDAVYLRIISPTTITSRMDQANSHSYESLDMEQYANYVKSFGVWTGFSCENFNIFRDVLIKVWEDFSGKKIQIKKRSIFEIFFKRN